MRALVYLILFVFGLGIGSFLNVVICRYRPEGRLFRFKDLRGRSHCPRCRKKLKWFELIPLLSFFVQGGRCRGCGERISFQYPLVELLSGLIFVSIPWYLSSFYGLSGSALVILWIVVFLGWLLVAVVDLRHFIIPDGLNLALGILGFLITVLLVLNVNDFPPFRDSFLRHQALLFPSISNIFLSHIIAAFIGGLLFGAISILSRGRAMGFGDAKLAFASGLILGWPDILLAIVLAFILGGISGLLLILAKKKTMKDKIPFAPFFVLGAVLTVFLGFRIVSAYFSFFEIIFG